MYKLLINSKRLLFAIAAAFFASGLPAQENTLLLYHDISQIEFEKDIRNELQMAYADPKITRGQFSALRFKKGLIDKNNVPPGRVTKRIILKFNICNSSDKISSVYFFPGRYYNEVSFYRITREGSVERIPDNLPENPDNLSYRKISLAANDSAVIIAELGLVKTYSNNIRPRLINEIYIDSFISSQHNYKPQSRVLSYIICGLLLMMILFSLINFFQGANKEFFHYSGYALFLGLLLFLKALTGFQSNRFNFFMEGYLDFILMCAGHLFYLSFLQRFLDTKNHHPFVHKLCNFGIISLIAAILIYTFLHYFSPAYTLEYYTETITKPLLLVLAVFFIFYARRHWQDKIFRYLFWGHLCMFVFSCFSYLFTFTGPAIKGLPEILSSSIFYYQVAILLELFFFLAGLSYKNKRQIIEQTQERERLKAENQLKEIEKKLAVLKAQEEERARISLDMHDELGSDITHIRLMSEMARSKLKEDSPGEIEKISQSANDVLTNMNAIIWSMNSGNDTLDNLVSYIRAYSLEYLENSEIHCRVSTPENIEKKELAGDKRRNIFLCVKETLHNVLKHSGASEIKIDFEINHRLVIRIADNGKGIDLQKLREFGNGLKSIKKRMDTIGGSFKIENINGTTTTLTLPL